jgi:hypothetical protein
MSEGLPDGAELAATLARLDQIKATARGLRLRLSAQSLPDTSRRVRGIPSGASRSTPFSAQLLHFISKFFKGFCQVNQPTPNLGQSVPIGHNTPPFPKVPQPRTDIPLTDNDTLYVGIERERTVADRRNLIGALGVAVIVLGGGTLLSYMVALGAQNKPIHWTSLVPVVAYGVIALGSASAVGVLAAFHTVVIQRKKLDQFSLKGSFILADLSSPVTGHAQAVNAPKRAEVWSNEVKVWLREELPHWEGHFRNISSTKHYDEIEAIWEAANRPRQDRDAAVRAVEELMRARLHRLGEIQVSLNR